MREDHHLPLLQHATPSGPPGPKGLLGARGLYRQPLFTVKSLFEPCWPGQSVFPCVGCGPSLPPVTYAQASHTVSMQWLDFVGSPRPLESQLVAEMVAY